MRPMMSLQVREGTGDLRVWVASRGGVTWERAWRHGWEPPAWCASTASLVLSDRIILTVTCTNCVCWLAAHFARDREPKVLITTCYKPSKGMYAFLAEILVSGL